MKLITQKSFLLLNMFWVALASFVGATPVTTYPVSDAEANILIADPVPVQLAFEMYPGFVVGQYSDATTQVINAGTSNLLQTLRSDITVQSSKIVFEAGKYSLEVQFKQGTAPVLLSTPLVVIDGNGQPQNLTGGPTTTHTCTGTCSDGTWGVITYCSCCQFDKVNGVIKGCKCCQTGCCVHSITETSASLTTPTQLKTELLKNFASN